jgi:N-acetylglutamate synthase-like GNAT family acetyltransferase
MIRDLEKDDIYSCVEIVKLNWGESESIRFAKQIQHAFDTTEYSPHYYVCELNGIVVGFAGMMPSHIMHNFWDFIWINIHPSYTKAGIGTQLTWFRIHEVQRQKGSVIQLITKEFDFFRKFGFQKVHSYASDTSKNWLLMVKQLTTVHL